MDSLDDVPDEWLRYCTDEGWEQEEEEEAEEDDIQQPASPDTTEATQKTALGYVSEHSEAGELAFGASLSTCSTTSRGRQRHGAGAKWTKSLGTGQTVDRVIRAKTIPVVKKRAAMQADASPYKLWLETSLDHEVRERIVVFDALGRSPVDSPAHPARLTPIKQLSMSEDAPAGKSPSGAKSSSSRCQAREDKATDEDFSCSLPRSFSQRCCNIFGDQDEIKPFDTMDIYFNCPFFKNCSSGFVRSLVLAGGTPSYQGRSVPSGDLVYARGDPGQSLFVIARGTAEIIVRNAQKRFVRLGGYFGEMQVLGVLPRRHETVLAKTSLLILEITSTVLMKQLRRTQANPDFPDEEGIEPAARAARQRAQMMSVGKECLFPDERRHFENEAVRLYREVGAKGEGKAMAVEARARTAQSSAERRSSVVVCSPASSTIRGTELLEKREAAQVQQRESLMTNLVQSIRTDMRQGFMMPAELVRSRRSHENETSRSATRSQASPNTSRMSQASYINRASPNASRMSQASHISRASPNTSRFSQASVMSRASPNTSRMKRASPNERRGRTRAGMSVCSTTSRVDQASNASSVPLESQSAEKVDDADAEVTHPLEVDVLPPLEHLSSVQKYGLLRDLKSRMKGKVVKATCVRTNAFMSLFASRASLALMAQGADSGFSQISPSPSGSA